MEEKRNLNNTMKMIGNFILGLITKSNSFRNLFMNVKLCVRTYIKSRKVKDDE